MNSIQAHLKTISTLSVIFLLTSLFPSTISARAKKKSIPTSASRKQNSRKVQNNSLSSKRLRVIESRRAQARRRAEAARQAAIARQRAIDNALRADVQALISRDNAAGEDPEVRRVALEALGEHAGTVVVMDPNSGRVYAIVNQEWALHRGVKPCSTIKLVTGLAGLNEQVIDPVDTVNISDSNRINLTNALAYSNNTYFQEVGGQVGFEKMLAYARRLGLGEKTGINAPNESAGQLPTPRTGYAVNHMSSHGDDFKVTAIQLATLVSAMANGGKLLSPRILRTPQELARFKPGIRRNINMNLDLLRYMVPGMVGAVNYGSGRRAHDPQATVAGKTGTCIESGSWIGLFASYAPLANPRLAVVVISKGPDARSHFPAAVAGRIYRELNGRFGTPTNLQIADAKANQKNSFDEEEGEEDSYDQPTRSTESSAARLETAVTPQRTAQPLIKSTQPVNSNVRRVLMPITPKNIAPKVQPGAKAQQGSDLHLLTRPRRVN
jgi:membrane peptidoglycan carboxypeptidase